MRNGTYACGVCGKPLRRPPEQFPRAAEEVLFSACSLWIDNTLLHVRQKSEAATEEAKDLLISFKCKVITPHCQNPLQQLSRGFKPRRVPFPSHISIALCCASKWNQKLLRRKRKVIFFHSFKCKVVPVITPHRHSPPPGNLEY